MDTIGTPGGATVEQRRVVFESWLKREAAGQNTANNYQVEPINWAGTPEFVGMYLEAMDFSERAKAVLAAKGARIN
ncbi:MAG: hypothetical protein ABII07_05070 [Patescibacteria group bacterium]|nr:hypothetical protein [Patescibacteria group bacterium]